MTTVMMGFSISLDGFIGTIERDDGGLHDWLFAGHLPFTAFDTEFRADSQQSVDAFREVADAIGAIIVGHTSFGDGDEPFFGVPTFVLSRSPRESSNPNVSWVSEGIEHALERAMEAAGERQVCIFGGASTAQQYLAAGLVDELRLTVVPVLFGDGLRLFDAGTGHRKLELVGSVATPTVTHLHLRLTEPKP